jgi:penicillin-insensitive murein endopeptidase
VDAIKKAVERVNERFPDTQPISIGHLSAQRGGPLSPHKSHQSGRDADIGYYYTTNSPWFARATAANLDRARTWALVKAFAEGDVEMIFIDSSIQRLLRDWALSHGESRATVERIIQVGSPNRWSVVRHIPGHATHLHVRFANPVATAVGARAEPFYHSELARITAARPTSASHHASRSKEPKGPAQPAFFEHRVRDGDTLYRLAHRYGTTVDAIQKANGLKGVALKPKTVLRIPKG